MNFGTINQSAALIWFNSLSKAGVTFRRELFLVQICLQYMLWNVTCNSKFLVMVLDHYCRFFFVFSVVWKFLPRKNFKMVQDHHQKFWVNRCDKLTLIFLIGEMLEKFLWQSDYIFGLNLMPGVQWSKNFSILTSHFEGQVQTACSHHGPSAKWSVYLIFTSAVASSLVITCTGYCVEWVRKNGHFST